MASEDSPLMQSIAALSLEPNRNLDHLPSDLGTPLLGSTFDFIKRPNILIERQKKALGPVFQNSMFFRRLIMMAEPDAAELLLIDKEQNFSSRLGWARLGFLFSGGILLRDFNSHRIHRRPLQAAFRSAVMNEYGDSLNKLVVDAIEDWPQDKTFHFQPAIKSLLLENAAALFLGAELGEESKKLNDAFVDLLGGTLAIVRYRIPGLAYNRSIKGKEYIENWLNEQYSDRLTSSKNDFFTSLCQASQDPEHAMTQKEVVEHTLLLLFAAHDTTTSSLSLLISLLSEHPEWQDKLREELRGHPEGTLRFSDISNFELTDHVFKESLRMYPPVFSVPRRSIREFNYKGMRIPSNSAIMLQVHSIHHDEKYWTTPYKFDPDRWSDERREFKNHPYQYIPFGAGAHKCIGFRFAEMQTKIFLFNFLRRFKVSAQPGRSNAVSFVPIPLPKDKLPVTIRKT